MPTKSPFTIAVLLFVSLVASANAQLAAEPPTERDALEIIATHEQIKASLYKIIYIIPGRQAEKDGFIHDNVIRVTAFGPQSVGQSARRVKRYLMKYTDEYGWFLESTKSDARGVYLEISSQKKGRVLVR